MEDVGTSKWRLLEVLESSADEDDSRTFWYVGAKSSFGCFTCRILTKLH